MALEQLDQIQPARLLEAVLAFVAEQPSGNGTPLSETPATSMELARLAISAEIAMASLTRALVAQSDHLAQIARAAWLDLQIAATQCCLNAAGPAVLQLESESEASETAGRNSLTMAARLRIPPDCDPQILSSKLLARADICIAIACKPSSEAKVSCPR